jgi:hypothetical protein
MHARPVVFCWKLRWSRRGESCAANVPSVV